MRSRTFVEGVYLAVYRSAIDSAMELLSGPPGRRPRRDLVELSAWFNELDIEDRDRIQEVVRLSADIAVFGFLAGLDGVRSFGADTVNLLIDGSELDHETDLHDHFREIVDQELGYD